MQNTNASFVTRRELIDLLNQDLSREVQAVTGYANSARLLTESDHDLSCCMKAYADAEFAHALTIVAQIDSLGGAPSVNPGAEARHGAPADLLRCELEHETAEISHYGLRVQQCEMLGEHAVANAIRQILAQEMEQFARLYEALNSPQ